LRFTVPRELSMEQVGSRRIVYSDLDYNMQMNNTKYANMVCDFLPNANKVRIMGLSLSYYREAAFGDVLSIERATDDNGTWYFRAKKENVVCFEAMVRTA
jgi:acyl-ACP thioesterase